MKKAETREMPIHIVIFILVLAIVIGGLILGSGKIIDWANILPGFENSESIEGIAYIRYDTAKDSLQYYDGDSWLDFKEKDILLDNKKIDPIKTKEKLRDLYFKREVPETIKLTNKINKKIKALGGWENGRIYDPEFTIKEIVFNPQLQRREIIIEASHTTKNTDPNPKTTTEFKITPEGSLYEKSISTITRSIYDGPIKEGTKTETVISYELFQYIDSPESEIISKTLEWRDSILNKPISLSFNVLDEKNEFVDESKTFCMEKIDDIYLNIDLNSPKTSC